MTNDLFAWVMPEGLCIHKVIKDIIFSFVCLCQQSSWNRNSSVVRPFVVRVAIISIHNAQISLKFYLLLPLVHMLWLFRILKTKPKKIHFLTILSVSVNIGAKFQNATLPTNRSQRFSNFWIFLAVVQKKYLWDFGILEIEICCESFNSINSLLHPLYPF